MTQNWTKMTSLDSQPTPALTQQKNNQKMLWPPKKLRQSKKTYPDPATPLKKI